MLPLAHCLVALILLAQTPTPPREPPRVGPDQREVPATPAPAPAPDPQIEAWTTQLVARLGDPNRAIARSAEAGLIALGPPAVPQLRKAADGNLPEVAEHARRALEEIRMGPPPFRRRPGGPDGPPPGMHDGEGGDRPWPPPFPREGRDRRDGPQGGNDARDGRGSLPHDGGDPRGGNARDGEWRDGPRRGGMPPDGPRDQAGRRDGEQRNGPPPRWRRREGPRGEGMRRDGPPPPDRDAPPAPPPHDDRRDDFHDAR